MNLRPIALIAATFLIGCVTTKQPPLAAPGISCEEKVNLGGREQTIFIRGRNAANPVLLFIHGGPGLPEMPFSHYNAELESDFTMVYWDQRGAGKSFDPGIPLSEMSLAKISRDAEQLTRLLMRRFGQKKIDLVGFSWGTLVAVETLHRVPELYRGYIGISQLVSVPHSELLLHREGIAVAEARGFQNVAERLHEIGEPPYATRKLEREVNKITKAVQPPVKHEMTLSRYIWLGLQSPYYSLADDLDTLRGIKFSGHALEHDAWSHDLEYEVPQIDVPVAFFLGRRDTVLSPTLGADYFAKLRAPHGKRLIWFERSDHIVHLEEAEKFRAELRGFFGR